MYSRALRELALSIVFDTLLLLMFTPFTQLSMEISNHVLHLPHTGEIQKRDMLLIQSLEDISPCSLTVHSTLIWFDFARLVLYDLFDSCGWIHKIT